MSQEKNKNSTLSQIIVAVIVALLVGSTSPWWWKEVKDLIVTQNDQTTPKAPQTPASPQSSKNSQSPVTPQSSENPQSPVTPQMPEVREDCLAFNPGNVSLQPDGARWLLTDGRSRMILFDNQQEAEKALQIIQYYALDSHCFVGRPDPSFEYWLANNRAPEGSIESEDCLRFNPSEIVVTQVNGRWKLVEGGRNWMFDFADKESEARQAFAVIEKYGFTHSCFVGRPNPNFQYLRIS